MKNRLEYFAPNYAILMTAPGSCLSFSRSRPRLRKKSTTTATSHDTTITTITAVILLLPLHGYLYSKATLVSPQTTSPVRFFIGGGLGFPTD